MKGGDIVGFVFRHDGLNTLVLDVRSASSALSNGLSSIKNGADRISGHSGWQGNKADSVKDYISNVHGAIIASLSLLLKDIYDQTMLYQGGYQAIDDDTHAIIPEAELNEIQNRLLPLAPIFDGLSIEAESIVRSVSHIGSISYAGLRGFPEDIQALVTKLDTLSADINQHESSFQGKFAAEYSLIQSLQNMLSEAQSMSLESFAKDALAKSENYRNLVKSFQALAQIVEGNSDSVKQAEASFEKTYKVLEAEYQERLEAAQKAKFWTGVLTAAVSAVVVTATGGAGIVLVASVGFASGAINAGVGSYFDQQVGTIGYPGSVNGWEVAGASMFGGFVGAATSCIGYGASNLSSGLSFAPKMLVEGGKSVAIGMTERAGDACFDSIVAGEPVLDVIKSSLDAATDFTEIASDFTGGCVGSAFTQGFDVVSDKFSGKVSSGKSVGGVVRSNSNLVIKADSPYIQQGYDIISGTIKETGKGGLKRFTKSYIKTGDIHEAWDSATDADSVLMDAATTAASSTASAATADAKIVREQRKINNIQKQINADSADFNERNKELCAERGISRTPNGTPDFSGTDACVAETEVRQSMSSTTDYKHAFNQMIAEGKIDPNEYSQNDSGHVTRTHTVIIDGKETVVQTEYTVHHVQYDINSGMGSFQLVETDAHFGIKHAGGDSQLQHAYGRYGAGEAIGAYNEAVIDATQTIDDKESIVKAVKQGGKSGRKISSNVSKEESEDNEPVGLNDGTDFTFLEFKGG